MAPANTTPIPATAITAGRIANPTPVADLKNSNASVPSRHVAASPAWIARLPRLRGSRHPPHKSSAADSPSAVIRPKAIGTPAGKRLPCQP